MAGTGYKSFTPSSLTSDEVNTYLMQQSVMVFASSAARSSALPVPAEGMVSFLKDTDVTQYYTGSAWVNVNSVSPTFTGTVLKTSQPIISGQIGSSGNITSGQLVPFDDFWVSRGITYNSSTRRFTVPTTGVYRITMNPFWNTGGGTKRIFIGVDTDTPNSVTHRGQAYSEASVYETGCLISVVTISANSYIVFRVQEGTLYNQSGDRFNQFSIELIG
jgi:hypothetical protein